MFDANLNDFNLIRSAPKGLREQLLVGPLKYLAGENRTRATGDWLLMVTAEVVAMHSEVFREPENSELAFLASIARAIRSQTNMNNHTCTYVFHFQTNLHDSSITILDFPLRTRTLMQSCNIERA